MRIGLPISRDGTVLVATWPGGWSKLVYWYLQLNTRHIISCYFFLEKFFFACKERRTQNSCQSLQWLLLAKAEFQELFVDIKSRRKTTFGFFNACAEKNISLNNFYLAHAHFFLAHAWKKSNVVGWWRLMSTKSSCNWFKLLPSWLKTLSLAKKILR